MLLGQNVFPSCKNQQFDWLFEKPSINRRPRLSQIDESIKSTKSEPFEMNRVAIDFETNMNQMNRIIVNFIRRFVRRGIVAIQKAV
jgi:hypothetical protein